MGTAMRFFVVLAGLGFMVFALAMIGPSLYDVFSATDLVDDPWGNAGVLLMLAAVAAAPFYVGVRLVRKGVRGGAALVSAAPEPPPAPIVSPAPEGSVKADAPSVVEPSPLSVSTSASSALGPADAVASPIVRLRPHSDLGVRLSDLRRPARWLPLLRTSYGLAIATYVVAAPLMLIRRTQSAEIGIAALAFYSLIDPIQNVTRPSWLSSAAVSFGVGMALFFALILTAGMLRYLGNDRYNFFFPLLLYVPMMGLSAIARLVVRLRWSDEAPAPNLDASLRHLARAPVSVGIACWKPISLTRRFQCQEKRRFLVLGRTTTERTRARSRSSPYRSSPARPAR